ncbi:GlxA family transcriptional regulator [Kordiimonas pumila]|uniref:GlxA family transcriptional regulator n=1 Tax=Kordiimonas pumila TaxID=2161677 RepID=A0ABV7D9X4_9PROT|nr:GlxA family transcriptional regulator [Kordiimonas pumila]
MEKHVVIVAYDGCQILDVTGPMQVFASANELYEKPVYKLTVASPEGTTVLASCGLPVGTVPISKVAPDTIDSLLVVGGHNVAYAATHTALQAWVKEASKTARRMCSVCTGAFILAAAGLTNNKRVTTHWRQAGELQQQFPSTHVNADAIYSRDGNLWSSAGVTAGIDMALALVEEDLDHQAAMQIARRLVVYALRPGNQSQFSNLLSAQTKAGSFFSELLQWLGENLHTAISVEQMAEKAGMSARSFHRRFVAETRMTPAKFLERIRVDYARKLLEETDQPLKAIAVKAGFGSDIVLIQAFERQMGMSPSHYRHLHGAKKTVHY